MFKVGRMAVHPAHGVVRINSVENKEICGTKKIFYILKVIDSDVTVMVPIENASMVGLRPIIESVEVPKVYTILKRKKNDSTHANGNLSWNKRYREYADKLKSGNIFEVAKVLKEIHMLKDTKELSFGEKRVLDSARTLLVKEISIAKNSKEDKVALEIERLLDK